MRATLRYALLGRLLVVGIVVAAAQVMAAQKASIGEAEGERVLELIRRGGVELQKAPIPDADAQERAKKAAAEIYGNRFRQTKTPADKLRRVRETHHDIL